MNQIKVKAQGDVARGLEPKIVEADIKQKQIWIFRC